MDPSWVLAAVLGLLAGGLLTWVILRVQHARALAGLEARASAEVMSLQERLAERDREIAGFRVRQGELEGKLKRLRDELTTEIGLRAAAVERANQIPEFLERLAALGKEREELVAQVAELRARRAELETMVSEERRRAEEKVAILNEAREKLQDAFKALAADGLQRNNEAFLDLARGRLEKLESQARGDLDQRETSAMKKEEILAKVAAGELKIEEASKLLEEAERERRSSLYCKVSQKGAVSVYGLQRMPVTLYMEQWDRLLTFGDEIRQFIKEHEAELKRKQR